MKTKTNSNVYDFNNNFFFIFILFLFFKKKIDLIFKYDSKKISSSGRKYTTSDIMILIHKLRSWYYKYNPNKL